MSVFDSICGQQETRRPEVVVELPRPQTWSTCGKFVNVQEFERKGTRVHFRCTLAGGKCFKIVVMMI
jgi:hypothetical protein